jgi:hypothetical protein
VLPIKLTWIPPGNFIFISPLILTDGTVLSAGFFSDRLKLMGASLSTAVSCA